METLSKDKDAIATNAARSEELIREAQLREEGFSEIYINAASKREQLGRTLFGPSEADKAANKRSASEPGYGYC